MCWLIVASLVARILQKAKKDNKTSVLLHNIQGELLASLYIWKDKGHENTSKRTQVTKINLWLPIHILEKLYSFPLLCRLTFILLPSKPFHCWDSTILSSDKFEKGLKKSWLYAVLKVRCLYVSGTASKSSSNLSYKGTKLLLKQAFTI